MVQFPSGHSSYQDIALIGYSPPKGHIFHQETVTMILFSPGHSSYHGTVLIRIQPSQGHSSHQNTALTRTQLSPERRFHQDTALIIIQPFASSNQSGALTRQRPFQDLSPSRAKLSPKHSSPNDRASPRHSSHQEISVVNSLFCK